MSDRYLNLDRFQSIVAIRSAEELHATFRLQSDPIIHGLQGLGLNSYTVFQNDPVAIEADACILFHYNDTKAIATVRDIAKKSKRSVIVCLGSDIYNFDEYLQLHDIVDMYIMPTEIHRSILSSQVYRPVYVLQEAIDSIAIDPNMATSSFPKKSSKKAFWFGYPESFYKGMASILPIIAKNLKSRRLSSFEIVTNERLFDNKHKILTHNFDAATFIDITKNYDYCILSHFASDLSLNSFIKSPNKLVTALMVGTIPIASNTPNYQAVLGEFGLQRFLFSSPFDLNRIFRNLDPAADLDAIRKSGIIEALTERLARGNLASEFLRILDFHDRREEDSSIEIMPSAVPRASLRQLDLREHLVDLLPSAVRAMDARWKRGRQ